MEILDRLLTAVILIAVFYVLFFIGKLIHDLLHREYNLTLELVEKDNPAVALAVAGYYLGLVLAIGGALVGPSRGIISDLFDLGIYGLLSIIMLNLSWVLCDRVILSRFRMSDELIRDRNSGTGAVSFGMSVATGLIIYGSVAGEGGSIWTAIAFWALGQVMLTIAAVVYRAMVPYDLHAEIEKDNVAAGVSFAGALIGMGMVVGLAAQRDFQSWRADLLPYVIIALLGLILLPVIRFLSDKVLLPTVHLTDEIASQETPNVGAAYIEAFSYIAASFVIYWCV
jgi:uncharacterized membrane protein YjfL (UPF0719 family)